MAKKKRAKIKRNNLKPLYAYLKVSSVGDERTWDFSGLRGIDIEKNIITSMVSTALTYIIILVQFKMSTL